MSDSDKRWMAEIRYRKPVYSNDLITFNEFVELERHIKMGLDWHEIENITITLNRSARLPQKRAI